jgi:DNA polymerase I-like protein with 3'-5' exonuclease and polymerase domains
MSDLPSWKGAQRVAVDVECKDPQLKQLGPGVRRDGEICGIAFAIDGGPKHYLPYRHKGGDNLPADSVISYMDDQLRHFEGEIVGANLSYDIDYLLEEGIRFNPNAMFRDVQVAAVLIYELYHRYSLDEIAKRYGFAGKFEEELKKAVRIFIPQDKGHRKYHDNPKTAIHLLPGRYVGNYAEGDVHLPLEILKHQLREIEQNKLQEIWDLESRVLPILVKMRRRGVLIDQDRLQQIEDKCTEDVKKADDFIASSTGYRIGVDNYNKSRLIASVLERQGITVPLTDTGEPNVDKEVLKRIGTPVALAIMEARRRSKTKGTFVTSIRRYMVNGRIHCSFNQMAKEKESGGTVGPRFGRMSATDPNLQQQPSRFGS